MKIYIIILLQLLLAFILKAQTPDPNAWTLQPWMQFVGYKGENLGTSVGFIGKVGDSTLISVGDANGIHIYSIKSPDDTVPLFNFRGSNCKVGDFNGDGIEDLVVGGSPLRIYLGKSPGVFETKPFFTKYPEPNSVEPVKFDRIAVGKINGDKYDDLVITDPDYPNGYGYGRVYIFWGGTRMDTVANCVLTGNYVKAGLGWGIATGDLNNDGFDDIIVKGLDASKKGPNGTIVSTYIKIYLGGNIIDTTAWKYIKGGNNSGRGVASFDVNGDGVKDLLWCNGNDTTLSFFLDIYFSHNNTIDTIPSVRIPNGWALNVANAGDMNGDGYNDIMVSGNGSDVGGNSYIFIYSGGPKIDTLFDAAAGLGGESNFGISGSMVSVGDINNDGYADILVGAKDYQWGSYQGLFTILLGSTNIPTRVKEIKNNLPMNFKLYQNYPNPFNPSTTIHYEIPNNGNVTLKVYDALGREVATLVKAQETQGRYEVNFNASNLASGIYFYQLRVAGSSNSTNNFVSTKKMLLIK